MKKLVVLLAVVLVLGLVTSAIAEDWNYTVTSTPLTVLGRPCAVIKTVRKGGPLGGFLGNTQVTQTTVTVDKKGDLVTLSSSSEQATGLGDKMITGTFNGLGLGGMYALGQAIRTPDTTKVSQNVSGANSASNSNATNNVTNSNTQSQTQQQGQTSGFLSPVIGIQ
jgi:hypothetical protein